MFLSKAMPFLVLATISAGLIYMTWAQPQPTPAPTSGSYRYRSGVKPNTHYWDWTTEAWSASDKPFEKIRDEVDKVEAEKELDSYYIRKVQLLAENSPLDTLAQFRWGYAMLRAPYAGISFDDGQFGEYAPVREALAKPESPKSYLYSRLRFLIMSRVYEYHQLKVVGKRLLQRDPKDTMVKLSLIRYLSISLDEQERNLSVNYSQDLVDKYPKWEGSYSTLGQVYMDQLRLNGNLSAADKGVAAYKKYISLLPKDARELRKMGENAIRIIQEEKVQQQKHGFKQPIISRG